MDLRTLRFSDTTTRYFVGDSSGGGNQDRVKHTITKRAKRLRAEYVIAVLGRVDPHPATLAVVFFWMHALLIITFLNYLPYSKHLHVATSLINVYLSNTSGPGQKGVMRAMDLEAEGEQFGGIEVPRRH